MVCKIQNECIDVISGLEKKQNTSSTLVFSSTLQSRNSTGTEKENGTSTMSGVKKMKPLSSLTEAPMSSLEPPNCQPSTKIEDDQEQIDDQDAGTYCLFDDISIQPVSVETPVPAPPKEGQTSTKPSDCNAREPLRLPEQLAADNIYAGDQIQQVRNDQNKQKTGKSGYDGSHLATTSSHDELETRSSVENADCSDSESSYSDLQDNSSPIAEQKLESEENIELHLIPSERAEGLSRILLMRISHRFQL